MHTEVNILQDKEDRAPELKDHLVDFFFFRKPNVTYFELN